MSGIRFIFVLVIDLKKTINHTEKPATVVITAFLFIDYKVLLFIL